MTACRRLLRHRWIAAMAIIVAALLTRMMIPTGYMPTIDHGHLVITLCAEQNPGMTEMATMPGMSHVAGMDHAMDHSTDHGMPDHDKNGPCGFGGLSLASLAAADPVLLALAILFIVATVFRRPSPPRVATAHFLWPPRTGPPLRA
jgi:hypothetical protein